MDSAMSLTLSLYRLRYLFTFANRSCDSYKSEDSGPNLSLVSLMRDSTNLLSLKYSPDTSLRNLRFKFRIVLLRTLIFLVFGVQVTAFGVNVSLRLHVRELPAEGIQFSAEGVYPSLGNSGDASIGTASLDEGIQFSAEVVYPSLGNIWDASTTTGIQLTVGTAFRCNKGLGGVRFL